VAHRPARARASIYSRLENVAQVPSTVLEEKDKTGYYTTGLLAWALERHAALLHMLLNYMSTVSAMPACKRANIGPYPRAHLACDLGALHAEAGVHVPFYLALQYLEASKSSTAHWGEEQIQLGRRPIYRTPKQKGSTRILSTQPSDRTSTLS